MGMNYYYKPTTRKVKQEDLHIGKKSFGWEFSFQGYEKDEYYNTPNLTSKKEWFEFLFLNSDCIYNEEDEKISFLDFANMVTNSKNEKNLNHYEELKKSNDLTETDFKDKEGYTFIFTDFS